MVASKVAMSVAKMADTTDDSRDALRVGLMVALTAGSMVELKADSWASRRADYSVLNLVEKKVVRWVEVMD